MLRLGEVGSGHSKLWRTSASILHHLRGFGIAAAIV